MLVFVFDLFFCDIVIVVAFSVVIVFCFDLVSCFLVIAHKVCECFVLLPGFVI